ncbi:MAG: complex I NDUFA9 subunit family protein [Acidiferrobacterales bacterium]
MKLLNICMLGGTGFVGHSIVNRLVDQGHNVTIVTRQRERHRELLVLPTLNLVQGNVFDKAFLNHEFAGADVVINLVGILNEFRDQPGFDRVHAELPGNIAEACRDQSVPRLLHMSALKASNGGPSAYLRSKGTGEDRAHQNSGRTVAVTSFRPSVIFGPGDSFINRFAALLKWTPGVLPLACAQARFQPVYVEDVARVFVKSIGDYHTFGNRYELCGPKVYTLKQIVEYVARITHQRRLVLGLGNRLSKLQAMAGELLPGKPISLDNIRSMREDSICSEGFPELFEITPSTLEDIVPHYLGKDQRTHPRSAASGV